MSLTRGEPKPELQEKPTLTHENASLQSPRMTATWEVWTDQDLVRCWWEQDMGAAAVENHLAVPQKANYRIIT